MSIKRIPRPIGTTQLAQRLNNSPNQRKKLTIHILKQYLLRNQCLFDNTKQLSLPEVANYLGLTEEKVMVYLVKAQKELGYVFNEDRISDTMRALNFLVLNWSLKAHHRIEQQTDILTRRQGTKFVPFLTKELNQSLALMLNSNRNLVEYMKAVKGPNETNIHVAQNNINQVNDNKYLTLTQALSEIENAGQNTIPEGQALAALAEKHSLDETPQVIATEMPSEKTDGSALQKANKRPRK